mmetsp:Transcript_2978/g.8376  ORF Transcript_2978/g.8376 Transcript_2978/m.8376 type:complete len:200 (+) Transcript_2978:18-617(+)
MTATATTTTTACANGAEMQRYVLDHARETKLAITLRRMRPSCPSAAAAKRLVTSWVTTPPKMRIIMMVRRGHRAPRPHQLLSAPRPATKRKLAPRPDERPRLSMPGTHPAPALPRVPSWATRPMGSSPLPTTPAMAPKAATPWTQPRASPSAPKHASMERLAFPWDPIINQERSRSGKPAAWDSTRATESGMTSPHHTP